MAGKASGRDQWAALNVGGDRSSARAKRALPAEPGEAALRRGAYSLGRKAHVVSELVLQNCVAEKDLEISQRMDQLQARFTALRDDNFSVMTHMRLTLGMFFGLIIVVGALLVDYRIIHEFWTRVAMDDLGHIAASLKLSVYFKSAQVVFATLAFHFMLETLSERGRATFIRFVFIITAVMLVGIGTIVALKWLPPGSSLFGMSLNTASNSGNDILASLGLAEANTSASGGELFKSVETAIWLVSLSMIFVIVTSIGALSLQRAANQFQIMSGAKVEDPDKGGAHGLGTRAHQLAQLTLEARRYGIDLEDGQSRGDTELEFVERKRAIQRNLLAFADAYALGLQDYQNALFGLWSRTRAGAVRELMGELKDIINGLGAYIDDHLARHRYAAQAASPGVRGDNVEEFDIKRRSGRR